MSHLPGSLSDYVEQKLLHPRIHLRCVANVRNALLLYHVTKDGEFK